jgi:hypothetical protein
MLYAAVGLARVDTESLKKVLALVHRGEIPCPLVVGDLVRFGLQNQSEDLLGSLRGLDEQGTRAVLVAVLAERTARENDGR